MSVSYVHLYGTLLSVSVASMVYRIMIAGSAEIPWKTGLAHILEPVLLRETKGLVLSESLLEKLERRLP